MRFNSVRSSDYSQSARAVSKASDQIFDAAISGKPDFTKISQEAIKGRSLERRTATEAEGRVAQAGIKAAADVRRTRMKADTAEKVSDIKRPAKRMAGVVAGLGAIGQGLVAKKEAAEAKAERLQLKQERDKLSALNTRLYQQGKQENEDLFNWYRGGMKGKPPGFEELGDVGSLDSPSPELTSTDTSVDTPEPSNSTPTSSSTGGSTKFTPTPGTGTMSAHFKKIYDLAVEDGRTKFPEIVAAQAMHETGHLQNPDSVYFQSGKTNPFGQTGDRGYGTMTRNGDSNGWSKFPDLQTAVSDHITLWHDTGNHSENYNAYSTISEGLSKVIPAYSPNSDPANKAGGFTESAYSASVKKILRDNGFDVK